MLNLDKDKRRTKMKTMFRIFTIIAITTIALSCAQNNPNTISLSGTWQIKLDPNNIGINENWMTQSFSDNIELPGTTDENGYGTMTSDTAYGILSREYEFIGPAWYNREIDIPQYWNGKTVDLLLERVLWESRVYLDGKEMGVQDALGTAHKHSLGVIEPGKHMLSVRVNNDMIHNIGDKGHGYGEYMQSIWNGIVGRIELQAHPLLHIESVKITSDKKNDVVSLEVGLSQLPDSDIPAQVFIREKSTGKLLESIDILAQEKRNIWTIPLQSSLRLWNEFDPVLYEVEIIINPDTNPDSKTETFGVIEVDKTDHHVLINGKKTFLRGNLDCIHFPLTGYPDMDKEGWTRIFETYKEYGLNHVRFHSWCPPEAAFDAADELGIYIQAEASIWIDWWMGVDMVARGRPEMNTKGYPQGIGKGDQDADDFIWEEMKRVVETYGNHPSFIMFCIGNELGSSDFDLMGSWIDSLKRMDPRRLYAASTARTITPYCDYSATHNVPGIGGVRQKMVSNLDWDYEEKYSQAKVPIIAHEIGQWPVYPDWNEIKKYTGTLKARNLEQLKNLALKNGLIDRNIPFQQSTAKLSALLYKDEIESFLRTPSCAGYQLLSMQDYIGQGEAVIGWLDSFYDKKGGLDSETARQYMSEVVPLVRLPRYTFLGGEELVAEAFLHQFGAADLLNQEIKWLVRDGEGKVRFQGRFDEADYSVGELHEVGNIMFIVPDVEKALKLELLVSVSGTSYKNTWPLWVYPKNIPEEKSDVIIANQLNNQVLLELENGKSVLLIANLLGDDDNAKLAAWKPLYWSASFFPGQSIETLGMLIDNDHQALSDFPTETFGSWNWYSLCEKAHGFDLKDLPADYHPIVQPISDFHYSRRLGSIFELKYGKGKLLVCGYNINKDRDAIPEVKQLRHSLINYMNSEEFDPQSSISKSAIKNMFSYSEPALHGLAKKLKTGNTPSDCTIKMANG